MVYLSLTGHGICQGPRYTALSTTITQLAISVNEKVKSFTFVLLFQDYFGYSCSLEIQ